jgi:predicted HTH domain antitoxin
METICIQTDYDMMAALNKLAKHRSVAPEVIAQEALRQYVNQDSADIFLQLSQLSISADDVKLLLAIGLFKEDKVSLGKAAEIAGYSEKTFAEILIRKGIYPIRYEANHLTEDFQNA